MALKWLFSPKTKAKDADATRLERIVPTAHKVQAPEQNSSSEHNTGTQHLEDSKSSLGGSSAAMPSSVVVVVDAVESASIVSEMDERSGTSSPEEEEMTESSKDYNSYCDKVGNGRPVVTTKECATKSLLVREPSARRIPALWRSASCRIMGGNGKSPNRLSSSMRNKLALGGPAADALKVSLVVPNNDKEIPSSSAPRNRTSTKLTRSKSLACLSPNIPEIGRDSTTIIPRTGEAQKRDHCPERPHRKVSMRPDDEVIQRRGEDSKENVVKQNKTTTKTKKKTKTTVKSRRSVSEEKTPENTGPTVSPEVMKSYVDQLQKRRRKKELVRNVRGRRAAEEKDATRKQLSNDEMDEYLTIIKEVRMAKRQAKSRAMQEAMALQRADFLARLIHVTETENKAANPVMPPANARI